MGHETSKRARAPRTGKVAALAATFFGVLTIGMAAPAPAQEVGPNRVTVDSVAVVGNYRLSTAFLRTVFAIQPSQTVSFREIQRGAKALMAIGQLADVTVRAQDTDPDHAVLLIEVEERPQVRRVEINGLQHASAGQVRDSSGLRPGEPYSPQEVLSAQTFIHARLAREGIPFATIDPSVRSVEGAINVVDVILDVTEGNRITVAELDVRGNERISDDEILGAMSIRPEGFFWFQTGTFDPDVFETDLATSIPDVFHARGYLDFQVLSDTLIVDPQTGKARLEIEVDEGPQYRIADFSIEGNEEFADSVLSRYFAPQRRGLLAGLGIGSDPEEDEVGRVFDQIAFEDAADQVRELYANEGYLYAQLVPQIRRNPRVEGQPPTVNASWVIREGLPAYVHRVAVIGNDYTYDWVVRERVFLLPGDRYSQARVIQSYQSIGALGFFETPLPPPDIQPDPQTGDVDIVFKVKEKQTGSVNFGTSVGGGVGLSGFVGYEQPNLFGQAKSGQLRWDFGRYLSNFEVSFTDPALFQSRVSGSVSLFNSRDRFFQFSTGRRRRLGGSVNFGFPVPGATRTRVFTGYSIARTRYELFSDVDDTSLFGLPPGTQSTLLFGVTRNTLDHPIFPTTGSRLSWNSELNGGLLGGDGTFSKQTFEATWWQPTGQLGSGGPGEAGGPRLALGISLKGGMIFGDASLFPFDRFWMGGVQFGQAVRGYDETSITPLGVFPQGSSGIRELDRLGNAYLTVTASYALRLMDNVSISSFFDAGNVWSGPQQIDPTRLYRGAGVGVQLVTPFGPIGFDYAYGFDKPEPGWQFHFKMGGM